LAGPLLYIYVKSLFIADKKLIRKNFIHFIFPIIYLLFFSIPILIYLIADKELLPFIKELVETNSVFFIVEDFYLLAYLIFTLLLLNKYKKAATFNFSNFKNKELLWVKHMLISALFIVVVDIIAFIYDFILPNSYFETDFVIILLLVLFLYFLGYYGVKQSRVLVPDFLLDPINENKASISLQNIDDVKIKQHISKIKEVLIKEKLFLDEDLTLNKLATAISLSDKKLSAIINQKMNTSFYDLINSCRLKEFKKRIVSGEFENLTILGIAYDCGFKSKSTFNRLFKLNTGISPSEYKNINKMSANPSKKTTA
jgi:AraC-like DNA-binding protein